MNKRPLWPLLPPVAVAAIATVMLSATHLADKFATGCGFHKLTGLHCPGCGGTRCAHALIQGDFISAISYNAIAFTGLAAFLLGSGYLVLHMTILGKPAPRIPEIKASWLWLVLAGVVAFTILRNIPTWPFSLLAP